MNILFISHKFYPDIGGIETCSEMFARFFSDAGHVVRILTWTESTSIKEFPFTVIRKPNYNVLFAEHRWADIVFENNLCLRLSWPRLFIRRLSIVVLHTWLTGGNGQRRWVDKLKSAWLKKSTFVVAVSNAIRQQCWPNAMVIANPYQESIFKVENTINRNMDFVFLGRLVSDKGVDLAIRAFHQVVTTNSTYNSSINNLSFTIIGDGPEKDDLKLLVHQLNFQNQIFFLGSLKGEKLMKCLNQHKFILVPSIWEEPFGLVALEGMACGCIPIVSDGGGLPEAVGNAGVTFSRNNISDLVKCINNLLNNPKYIKQLREAAEKHLIAHRSDVISKQYLAIIESITKKANYKVDKLFFS